MRGGLLSFFFRMRYFAFTMGSAVFQIIAVVILLNLLIALMNCTVERVQGKKETYWKFTRHAKFAYFFFLNTL